MIRLRNPRRAARGRECGYMLLFLMIAVAVITITLLSVAYNYKRMILRDREVEMVHRGEQYERAVRRFYRKMGRYPTSIEQLESTNKIRFLRKRYKDPMSPDGEWKMVHLADLLNLNGSSLAKAAGAAVQSNTKNNGQSGTATDSDTGDASSSTGSGSGTPTATITSGTTSASGSAFGNSSGNSSGSAFGNSSGSAFGSSSGSTFGQSSSGTALSGGANAANGQVLGGDIYGVVSKSRKMGIHSFGDKSRYSEWFFIYDPTFDKGQLPVGPFNPKMYFGTFASGNTGTTSGTTNANGTTTGGQSGSSAFGSGSSSTFGSGAGSGSPPGSSTGGSNSGGTGSGGTGSGGTGSTTNP